MTPALREALVWLLEEFHLAECREIVRDDAKQDRTWTGYTFEHPRVVKFEEVCRVVREAVAAVDPSVTDTGNPTTRA